MIFRRIKTAWGNATAAMWRPLERPLRIDEEANQRRVKRMGDTRLERFMMTALVATFVAMICAPMLELVEDVRWRAVATVLLVISFAVLLIVFAILYRAGRP